MFQAIIPPSLVSCPKPTSKRNTGIPPVIKQTKYGMKNAPVRQLLFIYCIYFDSHFLLPIYLYLLFLFFQQFELLFRFRKRIKLMRII